MKIQQMRQILAVSNSESINKAAQKLYMSQSALSASIHSAEQELGQPILKRSHNGIEMTDFGKQFVETSRKILELYDELLRETAPESNHTLAVSSQFLKGVDYVFLQCCQEIDGGRNSRLAKKMPGAVCQDVVAGISEVGVIVTPTEGRDGVFRVLEEKGLVGHLIEVNECVCMVGKSNPLYDTEKDRISCQDVSPYRRMAYDREDDWWGMDVLQRSLTLFPTTGILRISDSGSFEQILRESDCYFIGIRNEKKHASIPFYEDIRAIPFSDIQYPYDTIWVCRKNWKLSAAAKRFLREFYQLVCGETPPKDLD